MCDALNHNKLTTIRVTRYSSVIVPILIPDYRRACMNIWIFDAWTVVLSVSVSVSWWTFDWEMTSRHQNWYVRFVNHCCSPVLFLDLPYCCESIEFIILACNLKQLVLSIFNWLVKCFTTWCFLICCDHLALIGWWPDA